MCLNFIDMLLALWPPQFLVITNLILRKTGTCETRLTPFEQKLNVKPPFILLYLSNFVLIWKDLLPPSMLVNSNTRRHTRPLLRNNSRLNKHKNRMSTRRARNTNKIVYGSTLSLLKHPLSKGKIWKRSSSSWNEHSRPYRRMNANLPTLLKLWQRQYKNGSMIGRSSVIVVKIWKKAVWSSWRIICGLMPMPSLPFALLTMKCVLLSKFIHSCWSIVP